MEVAARLQMLFEEGICRPSDLDQQCLDQLARLPVTIALEALEQFSQRDLSDVRNFSALFVSIVRRVRGDFERQGLGQNYPGHQPHPLPPPHLPPPPQAPFMPGAMGRFDLGDPTQGGLYPHFQIPGQSPPQQPVMSSTQLGNGDTYNPLQPTGASFQLSPQQMFPHPQAMPPPVDVPYGPGERHDYGFEHLQMGVRVDEFHKLSPHAVYVHTAPALKLQQLWDEGIRLVSILDDAAWELLSELGAPEALAVVEDVANKMRGPNNLRNVNAFFMSVARRFLPPDAGPNGRGGNQSPGAQFGPGRGPRVVRQSPRGVAGDLTSLSAEVREKIDDILCTRGKYIKRTDFDQGVAEALKRLTEAEIMAVLDDLSAASNLTTVKNMPAFIMSIIRRHQGGGRF